MTNFDEQASGVPSPSPVRHRSTDSPLTAPSAGRAFQTLLGVLRLRCPNCRRGGILRRWFGVHERCSSCNFRFERSDENYFQGAMIVNYLLGGFGFAASFLAILVLSWPRVPWTALTYGAPVLLVVFMVLLYPVSRVVWLSVDVMVRPVSPDELV